MAVNAEDDIDAALERVEFAGLGDVAEEHADDGDDRHLGIHSTIEQIHESIMSWRPEWAMSAAALVEYGARRHFALGSDAGGPHVPNMSLVLHNVADARKVSNLRIL